ncbi:MAG: Aspartyl-tRNA synthetase [Microgenomates group bacterium GW2011_GWA2_47_8]|nr:MAG: Aspartyl-tRNA synthetase [Microgenomates group bacterium GW2011_GWA2_47_8]
MTRTLATETTTKIGEEVLLQGWIDARRDHGKITFLDLRDRSGVVQLVLNTSDVKGIRTSEVSSVRPEYVIEVMGLVKERPASMVNPKLDTGTVEVEVKELRIFSKARELPFPIDTDGYDINEEIRLKYRYLDLRRARLQKNIRLRSKFVDLVRQYLFSLDFTEIETPMLSKSTPEGSRDFLVPSRLQPGKFYALPQSPQQYKQLLMVAGFERYFQIARCMRDEDLRADRGFEHSQIDIEMSFVDREAVMAMDEGIMISVMESLGYTIKQKPFPVISYSQAMEQYGADKFDMRSEKDKKNGILAFAWVVDFPFFEKTQEGDWTFTHNPFSSPKPEHKEWLLNKQNIGEILTTQYDLVCNGYEVGGGSIRSHEPALLESVFEVMGYEKEKIHEQFGHMLEAFTYGVPPHGGLAHGIERLLMTITREPYLREVVAFPQSAGGKTSVMDAPSEATPEQLLELGISVTAKKGNVFDRIIRTLEAGKAQYHMFEHEPVRTSEDAARVRNTPLHKGAKALVLYGDKKPLMVVLPADCKLDMKLMKDTYGIRDLRMATPDEVQQVTGVTIGAVPPFGNLFDIPVYMDRGMRDNEEIFFNAGLHTKSISMRETDFESVVKPIIGVVAKTS